jgi:hypothetical protein
MPRGIRGRHGVRDKLTIANERTKLLATSLNAIGLAILGFAILRPLIDGTAEPALPFFVWPTIALAFHGSALYILGLIEKEDADAP